MNVAEQPPPRPPPSQFARSINRESAPINAILAAAESCFSRCGYAGASMREIAASAGVSKSLVHYHFASKEHLFSEVQIRAYNRLSARVMAAVSQVSGGKERGLVAFDALFAALRENNDLGVQAELWASALSDPRLRVHVVRLREFFRDLLVYSIGQILGPDRDGFPLSVEAAADLIWATLNGLGLETSFGEPGDRVERAILALRRVAELALQQMATAKKSKGEL